MRKRFLPLSMLLITMMLTQAGLAQNNAKVQGKYTPRSNSEATFSSYMKSIRANQETGLIDPALLINSQENTREGEMNWIVAGPDNFGSLTRAMVFDKNDATGQTLYIGTMGGHLFRTTNNGITFQQVAETNLNISCMVQAEDGSLFIGTGDGRGAAKINGLENIGEATSFAGTGIYRFANGALEQLASTVPTETNGWAFVNDILISGNKIYATTESGIMMSEDNGSTWTNLIEGSFVSIKANNAGDILAADASDVYLSKQGGAFNKITGTEQLPADSNPKIIAMSTTDANFMYIAYLKVESSAYAAGNIYFTSDNAENWDVALASTSMYPIFGKTADYNGFMAVYPNNPRKLLVGSDDIWSLEDKTLSGANSYRPIQVSLSETSDISSIYVHEGVQNIIFTPNNTNKFFIGTEGGVFKGTFAQDEYSFVNCNRYFITEELHQSVTRMMSVAFGGDCNRVLGGSLDHGTINILGDENVNNIMTGRAIFPNPDITTTANGQFGFFTKDYAGGPCAISTINPDYIFVSATGNLDSPIHRSETSGEDYDASNFTASGTITNADAFKTPFVLYENYNDIYSIDSVKFFAKKNYVAGDKEFINSNINGYPFEYTFTSDLAQGDSIMIQDVVTATMVCAIKGNVYMSRNSLMFNQETEWWKLGDIDGIATALAISANGETSFVGTVGGKLYKATGINQAVTEELVTTSVNFEEIAFDFNAQAITSIAINPNNGNNIIVTLGNYGNDNYVYESVDGGATFTSKQQNLPKSPVYASIINKADGKAMLGTEKGIYTETDNGWVLALATAPVMELKQAIMPNHDNLYEYLVDEVGDTTVVVYPGIFNEGMIYAATYGNGILKCDTYWNNSGDYSVEENEMSSTLSLNIYPNPVRGNANISINLSEAANVSYQIYDLAGRMVANSELGVYGAGEHTISFSTENLANGSYIVRMQAGNNSNSAKILVY
ncbi:MAG: T9SS type A sorting domain-containing protein [Candidatus Limimorpha sp.]